jgi:hypothetical protein
MKKFFFLIPALYSSPVEGALALAYEFKKLGFLVEIIVLSKSGKLNDKYKLLNYKYIKKENIFKTIFFLRKYFFNQKKKFNIRIVSFTIVPDFINFFLKDLGLTFTSVRGDLTTNYFYKFFPFGFFLSRIHYFVISKIHIIFSMTTFMQKEIKKRCNRESFVVGNFINEKHTDKVKIYKKKPSNNNILRLLFLANLDLLKKPFSLISIANQLERKKIKFKIYVVGKYSNIVKNIIIFFIKKKNSIKFYGYKKNPFKYFYISHYLLHTSISEGIPRSVIEALYLRLPVIIRDSYGTNEYINNSNGFLFKTKSEICDYLIKNYYSGKYKKKRVFDMPKLLQKKIVVSKYMKKIIHDL